MFATTLAVLALVASSEVVEGHGEDADAAWARALEAAQDRVRSLVASRDFRHAPEWRPDSPALAPELLRRTGAITPLGEPTPSVVVAGRRLVVARYRVVLTPEYEEEARRVARTDLARARQLLLGRILAGILVALGVAAGYLRLEEWTRGYATKLLRLAAVIVLALAGLALWLFP